MIMFKMSSSLVNKILNRSTNVFGNRNEKVNKGNKKTNPHRCSWNDSLHQRHQTKAVENVRDTEWETALMEMRGREGGLKKADNILTIE